MTSPLLAERALCSPCRGSGRIRNPNHTAIVECWYCDGKGWVPRLYLPQDRPTDEEAE